MALERTLEVPGHLVITPGAGCYIVEFWCDDKWFTVDYVDESSIEIYRSIEHDCKLVFEKTDEETVKLLLKKDDKRIWIYTFDPRSPVLEELIVRFRWTGKMR